MIRNQFTPEQEKWLQELESGRHKQTQQFLKDGFGYCCLGVACEFVFNISWHEEDGMFLFERMAEVLSPNHVEKLCLYSPQGEILEIWGNKFDSWNYLTQCNDNGMTFADIAGRIRKYPWAVFSNFDAPKDSQETA